MLPLAGIRVVEIAQNLAGPYAGLILARLGADVIKVERPDGGDDARGWGPPFLEGVGSTFHAANAGKRSITVDLKDAREVAWLRGFITGADVLLQNLRPGALEEIGLGPDAARALNPRLIYCSLSAFGPEGPLRMRPGYEPMVQAFAGLMMVSGTPEAPPLRLGVPVLDVGTGMWSAIGILAGLVMRQATGRGCVVDSALFETALAWLGGHFASYRLSGNVPERHPTGSSKLIPFQAFETKTGPIVIAAGNDRLFAKLAHALERPDWAADSRFKTNADRYEHRDILLAGIEAVTRTRTKGEWLDRLEQAGVPCAPVHTLPEVVDHAHTQAAEIVQRVPGLDLDLIGLPLRFDGRRPPTSGRAPGLGEDNPTIRGEAARRIDR
jgi:crotonobetainyl-CoA:carnitine CoA-transferase CaiB-like acyl-CoA transferase